MRALSMIASILLLFTLGHQVAHRASAAELSVSARSAVLYETVSERFVYLKDADTRRPMASTTKIMTALTAIRFGDLDSTVTVPREAVGIEGSSLYLREGERLPLTELLYALLLQSANDAAVAIAIHVSGSEEAFVGQMNALALDMGLTDTHFMNPHGLHHDLHYTTARELALMTACALEEPLFREIVSAKTHTVPATELSAARPIANHNKLLRLYDGACGVKTGFTKRSGRCLVGAVERDGLTLVSVTLSAPNDWKDHEALFDLGLSSLESRCIAPRGSVTYSIPVVNGTPESITCTNAEDVFAVLPRGAQLDAPTVELPRFAVAPVQAGEVLGTLRYSYQGKTVAEISLTATESISEIQYRKGLF